VSDRLAVGPTTLLVVLLLAVAFAARLGVVLYTPGYHLQSDPLAYDRRARAIALTGHYPYYRLHGRRLQDAVWPPGYPYFLAGVYRLTGQSLAPARPGAVLARWKVARIVQALIGALTAGLIGLVGRQLWGRRVGLLALAIASVYLPLALVSVTLMTEATFVPLALGALACVLAARSAPRPTRWIVAAGVLVGLAALTRDDGVVLLVPLALGTWHRPRRLASALRGPLVLIAVAALTVAPWTVRNALELHAFIPITDHLGKTLAGTYNDTSRHFAPRPATWLQPDRDPRLRRITRAYPTEVGRDGAYARAAVRYMAANPAYVAEAFTVHSLRMLGLDKFRWVRGYDGPISDLSVYWFWPIGLLALAGACTRAARAAPRWVWLIPLLLWAAGALVQEELRFRAPIDPFFVLGAALALDALAAGVRHRARGAAKPVAAGP
jgi:4-amino-4-deoxy-L-arabinose transferase-like glycosyltransferase